MLKSFFVLFILNFSLFAASFDLKPVKTQLVSVDDIYGYVKDSPEIKLNSSGVVVQSFSTSKTIIARASVVAKENGLAKLEFSVFDTLEQNALPLPNILPQSGDEVILNFLYDRGLIVAPNEEIYNEVLDSLPQIYFTHIDIFGASLIRNSVISPKRSNFRKFCNENAVGVVVFALQEKARIVDCQDFNELFSFEISKASEVNVPFYSRINGYKSSFFDFNSQEIGNYYRYYETLIELN